MERDARIELATEPWQGPEMPFHQSRLRIYQIVKEQLQQKQQRSPKRPESKKLLDPLLGTCPRRRCSQSRFHAFIYKAAKLFKIDLFNR